MIFEIPGNKVSYDKLIQNLCRVPYYGHSNGCPNAVHSEEENARCSHKKLIDEVFDLNENIFVIATRFNLGEFVSEKISDNSDIKFSLYSDNSKKSSEHVKSIAKNLREKRPDWSESYFPSPLCSQDYEKWASSRMAYNPRWWQPIARKIHKQDIEQFLSRKLEYSLKNVDRCPEARGVNVTGLMSELGIRLEWQWPPEHRDENETYLVSLAGTLF